MDRPDFPSADQRRKDIFDAVLRLSFDGFRAWKRHYKTANYRYSPSQLVQDDMRTGPSAFQAIVSLEMSLQYGASTSSQPQDGRLNLRRHLPVHEPPTHEGDEGVVEAGEAGIEDPTFDDYDTAPPLLNAPSPSGTYTFGANGVLQKEKMWSRWIDRGLRLIPGFHIAFSKTQAIPYLQEQSLGTGESQPDSSPWTHSSDETSSDVERRSENEGTILQGLDNGPSTSLEPGQGISGLVDLGLREMLDEAGPQADAAHSQRGFASAHCNKADPPVEGYRYGAGHAGTGYGHAGRCHCQLFTHKQPDQRSPDPGGGAGDGRHGGREFYASQ